MKCPVCNLDMVVVEYHRVELDHCTRCRGVWFDCHELELLLATAGVRTPALVPSPDATEAKRRCPMCGRKMHKALAGKSPGVLIDACPREDGLWFDGGEVAALIEHMGGAGDSISSFLGEVFRASFPPGKESA